MADFLTPFLTQAHQWILAFHIIAVMFWMAGMYYLPRLYVYHAQAYERDETPSVSERATSEEAHTFEAMEEKLLKIIINPSMIAAWFFGLLLLVTPGMIAGAGYWLGIKFLCLFILLGYHGFLARWRKQFLAGAPPKSSRFFRLVNEIPPLLTIVIVIMVVVRPF